MIKAGAMCSSSTNSDTKLDKHKKPPGGHKYEVADKQLIDNAGDHQPVDGVDGSAEETPRLLNPFE